MNNKIIITGGSGFIGRALSSGLITAGFEPVIVSRRASGEGAHSWEELPAVVNGAAGIINLAGENIASGLWTKSRMRRIRESRVRAGSAVAEAVRNCAEKPGFLIQASACGYYGNSGPETVDEQSPAGKTFLAEVCTEWENSTAETEAQGLRRCIARFGIVLGHGGFLEKYVLPFKFFLGGPFGSGNQYISWVHIDDVVSALVKMASDENMKGAYNVTAPEPVTNNELAAVTAKAMNRPCFFRVPAFALRLAAGRMADELFLGGQRAVPSVLLKNGFQFRCNYLKDAESRIFRFE